MREAGCSALTCFIIRFLRGRREAKFPNSNMIRKALNPSN